MKQFFKNAMMLSLGLCMILLMTSAVSPTSKVKVSPKKVMEVRNDSKYAINNIYISHVDEEKWGDDLLGDDELLMPSESIKIEAECGEYDVKLVDEDEITCELASVRICAADTWVIGDLTECHGK